MERSVRRVSLEQVPLHVREWIAQQPPCSDPALAKKQRQQHSGLRFCAVLFYTGLAVFLWLSYVLAYSWTKRGRDDQLIHFMAEQIPEDLPADSQAALRAFLADFGALFDTELNHCQHLHDMAALWDGAAYVIPLLMMAAAHILRQQWNTIRDQYAPIPDNIMGEDGTNYVYILADPVSVHVNGVR